MTSAYIARSDLDSAFVVAKADSDGIMPRKITPAPPPPPQGAAANARERLDDVAGSLAARFADEGEPLKAAMCFLAVSATTRATTVLSRASELILGYLVSELLSQPKDPIVVKLVARCLEREQRWDAAADVLRQLPDAASRLAVLAVRCSDPGMARAFESYSVQQYSERFQSSMQCADYPAAVLSAVCCGEAAQAIEVATSSLFQLFGTEGWTLEHARSLLDPLEGLNLQKMSVREIASVLACASYIGLVEASASGYVELMFPLAQTLRNLITHQSLAIPISNAQITLLEAEGFAGLDPREACRRLMNMYHDDGVPSEIRHHVEQRLAELQPHVEKGFVLPQADGPGLAKIPGGNLPSCYRRFAKKSCLTNELIRGPAFELEDRKSFISLPDALAWIRVNVFSPLNTGCKLDPI